MSKITRRHFLGSMAVAGAAFTIGGTKASGRILGANDTLRIGVAGLHGRGAAHVEAFAGMKNVQVVYLVDPDTRTFANRLKYVREKGGNTPKMVQDVRRALDDADLDAISIATPNHWHSLITVWACQAGKDVYVEKPCSHNLHEGRIAVETARKFGRIVQHGTQSRTGERGARAAELAKSGVVGKLLVSRGLCYKPRESIGFKPAETPPKELDFNLWLGPAPQQPYHENLVHYNWHWFWDTGNGDIGNQGVHEMDLARWGIPGATLPRSVISVGGRFGYVDQGQTANTQIAIFDYGETQLIFEVRGLKTEPFHGQKIGNIYHYEQGIMAGDKFIPNDSTREIQLPEFHIQRGPGKDHFENFVAAVRSRKVSDLNADILEGHYSSALCHLANISYRLGQEVPFNPRTKAFGDDKEAYESLARMEEHLARDNGLQLDGIKYRLGRKLVIDPQREVILNDPEANQMLTRLYRPPFVVPDQVA
ncbi:MAG: Gfo/Idh/MocA family oxidoreductase [Candidatus Omnitrophica bacterium]|nr:Gfo/Idh/MocA family oxidoreductase [Candidatus Omnitrophota bacterium]